VNEKVYTVSLFTIALLSWLAFRWRDRGAAPANDRLLLLGVYLLALSVGNHLMAFLAAPALLLFVLLVRPRALLRPMLWAGGGLAVVVGLSVHLFLPIRSELGPVVNENEPTCATLGGALTSIVTMGRQGCPELSASLARTQYLKPSIRHDPVAADNFEVQPRTAPLVLAQIANYVQYFDWQWARSVAGRDSWFGGARPLVTLLFIALGLIGAATHYRSDRVSGAYLSALFATLSIGLVAYMNFEYGYSVPFDGVTADMREVRERDYFFLAGFSVWGLWCGIGLTALWRRAVQHLATARLSLRRAELAAAPVLAIAFVPLVANWNWASRADDHTARDWAYNLLMSVEPYGVLFTNGDNDTFPLWYVQEVEGIRKDVTVVIGEYLNTPWYARQIRDLTRPCTAADAGAPPDVISCQRPYVADHGAPYAAPAHPPEDSILPLTDEQIGTIAAGYYVVPVDVVVRAAGLQTTLRAGTVLEPADTFVTAILQSSLGARPIHFVAPSPPLQTLNLTPHTVRTGLTLRLAATPVPADGPLVRLPDRDSVVTGQYIDLERTQALLDDVFVYRDGLPRSERPWPDASTTSIALNYYSAHAAAANGYAIRGDAAAANRNAALANAWGVYVR
jgi:hypothetical protein